MWKAQNPESLDPFFFVVNEGLKNFTMTAVEITESAKTAKAMISRQNGIPQSTNVVVTSPIRIPNSFIENQKFWNFEIIIFCDFPNFENLSFGVFLYPEGPRENVCPLSPVRPVLTACYGVPLLSFSNLKILLSSRFERKRRNLVSERVVSIASFWLTTQPLQRTSKRHSRSKEKQNRFHKLLTADGSENYKSSKIYLFFQFWKWANWKR